MERAAGLSVYAVLANFILWPVMQLGVAWVFLQLPERIFRRNDAGAHLAELYVYGSVLRIKWWKRWLPDGGSWMGGFSKKTLRSHQVMYLERFIAETRRGEAAHWISLLGASVFFLWNPRGVWPVLIAVALLLNAPCILVQRYNRFVLLRTLRTNAR